MWCCYCWFVDSSTPPHTYIITLPQFPFYSSLFSGGLPFLLPTTLLPMFLLPTMWPVTCWRRMTCPFFPCLCPHTQSCRHCPFPVPTTIIYPAQHLPGPVYWRTEHFIYHSLPHRCCWGWEGGYYLACLQLPPSLQCSTHTHYLQLLPLLGGWFDLCDSQRPRCCELSGVVGCGSSVVVVTPLTLVTPPPLVPPTHCGRTALGYPFTRSAC